MSKFEVYKDGDNLVEVLHGNAEKPLRENTADGKLEKHVPFIEEVAEGYLVKVGEEMAHPMEEDHWIEFIELIVDGNKVYRQYLTPSDKPEALFKVEKSDNVYAREYCNLHGLWRGEK